MSDESIELPIICRRLDGVFTEDESRRHQKLWGRIEASIRSVDELEAGYAFVFPYAAALFLEIAEFVTYERLCCPFFQFGLEIYPGEDGITLELTGGEGVKEYLATELAAQRFNL
jgi:hypothetical protein